ncbi:MAG: hypothetical protein HQ581_05520 [Planctomycetes bacterium]|nr:hypothetical protein [Planctomycetota bacterium]
MNDDPIVEEVRKARDEYAKQFGYDLDAICRDLQEKQQQPGRQLVSFPPKSPRSENKV